MGKRVASLVCMAILCLFSNAVYAIGDPAAGEKKSTTCAVCHQADGNSISSDFPKLAGQSSRYFIAQLQAFRLGDKGPRPNPVMAPLAAGLSDKDIEDLAAFYEKQVPTSGKANPALVERGERLYRGGDITKGITACTACHGPAGEGLALAGFPSVAGQMDSYIYNQLKLFQNGKRKTTSGMMGMIAARMADEDMKAVASYIAGLESKKE